MKTSTTYRLFGLILIVAAAARLYGIHNPLYDWNTWRQTETAAIAMNYYQDRLPLLYPEIDWAGEHGHAEMEFPLYAYMISWLYRLTVPWDLWGRILTLMAAVGTTGLMFDIGKRLMNPILGLFAAGFFGAYPLTIYYGRVFMPDMMMVFFATLSVAWLLRWQPQSRNREMILAAIAFSLAVLMKPPCLMVSFPLLSIFYQKTGWDFMRKRSFWVCIVIVILPAALWYAHANSFFQETHASFMWHFKGIGFGEYLEMNWQWRNGNVILWERITQNILAYAGWFPLALGMIRLMGPHPVRPVLILWLTATVIYYAVIAAHHRGHDYYSLLPAVSLALVCGYGCEWLYRAFPRRVKPAVWLLPLSVLILGWIGLLRFEAYRQWYFYYQDAKAMQEVIPEDALILVMDEIPHTPEFFYFINRNGWHRLREPYPMVSDEEWVERHRRLGADYYVGLNEAPGNHPLRYLQTHPMGLYLRGHYEIEYIGTRFFIANLNRPMERGQDAPPIAAEPVDLPAVIQAEQFLRGKSTVVPDSTADRASALYAETQERAQVVIYGPYFYFPFGEYDIIFRLRSPQPPGKGVIEIALSDSKTAFASKRLAAGQEVSRAYQDFTLTAKIEEQMPLDIRLILHPHTQAVLDTVSIRHRAVFDPQTSERHTVIHLAADENRIIQVTDSGMVFTLENEFLHQWTQNAETVQAVHPHSEHEWVWISDRRVVYDPYHYALFQLPDLAEGERLFALTQAGQTLFVLTTRQVFIWNPGLEKFPLPHDATLPRDIAVDAQAEIYVLFGSGKIIQLRSGQRVAGIPDFGVDVCRRLIPHQAGFYVLDALGAIHNTPNISPVRSPYYQTEEWITDAERTVDGQWAYLTRDGKVLTFEE